MDHRRLRMLAAGAALGDLDPAERVTFVAHLMTCPACRALKASLGDVMADLACLLPEVQPPPTLRAEILASLRPPAAGPPRFR